MFSSFARFKRARRDFAGVLKFKSEFSAFSWKPSGTLYFTNGVVQINDPVLEYQRISSSSILTTSTARIGSTSSLAGDSSSDCKGNLNFVKLTPQT